MNGSPSDLASLLGRCQTGITLLLRQTSTPAERAARLADLLLELFPHAGLTACLLHDDGPSCLALRPQESSLSAEQKSILRSQLSSMPPSAASFQVLPSAPQLGLRLLAAAIHEEDRPRG